MSALALLPSCGRARSTVEERALSSDAGVRRDLASRLSADVDASFWEHLDLLSAMTYDDDSTTAREAEMALGSRMDRWRNELLIALAATMALPSFSISLGTLDVVVNGGELAEASESGEPTRRMADLLVRATFQGPGSWASLRSLHRYLADPDNNVKRTARACLGLGSARALGERGPRVRSSAYTRMETIRLCEGSNSDAAWLALRLIPLLQMERDLTPEWLAGLKREMARRWQKTGEIVANMAELECLSLLARSPSPDIDVCRQLGSPEFASRWLAYRSAVASRGCKPAGLAAEDVRQWRIYAAAYGPDPIHDSDDFTALLTEGLKSHDPWLLAPTALAIGRLETGSRPHWASALRVALDRESADSYAGIVLAWAVLRCAEDDAAAWRDLALSLEHSVRGVALSRILELDFSSAELRDLLRATLLRQPDMNWALQGVLDAGAVDERTAAWVFEVLRDVDMGTWVDSNLLAWQKIVVMAGGDARDPRELRRDPIGISIANHYLHQVRERKARAK